MIFELVPVLEIDFAFAAQGQFITLFIADMNDAQFCAPDRAFMRQPFLRVQRGETVVFGTRIIFVNNRPPPLDHLMFHRDRARAAACTATSILDIS